MSKTGQVVEMIRGAVILAGSAVFIWTLVIPGVQSFMEAQRVNKRIHTIPQEVTLYNQETTFKTLCPAYAKASTWERWTNTYYWDISWCKDYVDRL